MDSNPRKPNDILRNQRLLRGWSQQKVAEQLGTNEDTVSRWERGERKPSPFYQEQFCRLYEMSAEELGFMSKPIPETDTVSDVPTPLDQPSSIVLLSKQQQAFLLSLLAANDTLVQESGETTMNLSRRHMLQQIRNIAGAAFVLPSQEWPFEKPLNAKQSSNLMNGDLVAFFENAMIVRWELYYTGGAIRAAHDLDTWMKEITKLSQGAQGTDWHIRALVLLTMSYQLQSCVLRDMMEYTQAHGAYQRAFHVAQELDDPELMSSALARKGVMLIQQERLKEAILYLHGALDTIDGQSFPRLKGHILQGLSEAYAKTQQMQECWHSLGQAEEMLAQQ